ncbi:MAG: fluoride efflux transporter CrcB [Pseudomonadota bacterium]
MSPPDPTLPAIPLFQAMGLVALGGALGSALRYLSLEGARHIFGGGFPVGTLVVNIAGSCALGLLMGVIAMRTEPSHAWRLFVGVGLLSGFTTFSAFSLDAITLIERGSLAPAGLYMVGSVLLSALALFAGLALGRAL